MNYQSRNNRMISLISEVKEIIELNQDNRTKEVGDKVKVWDGSGNIDKTTGEHRSGIDPLFTNTAIVIETGCKIIDSDPIMNKVLQKNCDRVCDLLLAFPSGEQVYCSSNCVKIVE